MNEITKDHLSLSTDLCEHMEGGATLKHNAYKMIYLGNSWNVCICFNDTTDN